MLPFINENMFSLIFYSPNSSPQLAPEATPRLADGITCPVITPAELHAECGIVLSPNFSVMRRFCRCQEHSGGGRHFLSAESRSN